MITGTVTENLDLLVTVEIANSNGVFEPLEVIMDTGFNGDLALPRDVILDLGLAYRGQITWTLATGQEATMANYDGVLSWHGRPREVGVVETESESLLGMALLIGSKFTVDARIGGEVVIEENSPAL